MIEAPLEGLTFQLAENPPAHGIVIVDTSDMFCALEGDASQKRSLEKMCHLLGYQTQHMHNAGNDAHVESLIQNELLPLHIYSFLTMTLVYNALPEKHGIRKSDRPTTKRTLA